MRKEYDFTNSRPNPFASRLKRAVTIRLDQATIAYFQELAAERRASVRWAKSRGAA